MASIEKFEDIEAQLYVALNQGYIKGRKPGTLNTELRTKKTGTDLW